MIKVFLDSQNSSGSSWVHTGAKERAGKTAHTGRSKTQHHPQGPLLANLWQVCFDSADTQELHTSRPGQHSRPGCPRPRHRLLQGVTPANAATLTELWEVSTALMPAFRLLLLGFSIYQSDAPSADAAINPSLQPCSQAKWHCGRGQKGAVFSISTFFFFNCLFACSFT